MLLNMLLLLTSQAFPLVEDCGGQLWPAFDPFDLDEGCHLAAAEDALRSVIPSGPIPEVPVRNDRGIVCIQYLRRPHPPQTPPPPPRSLPCPWGWGLAHRQPVVHGLSRSFSPLPGGPPAPSSYAIMGSRLGMWHVW